MTVILTVSIRQLKWLRMLRRGALPSHDVPVALIACRHKRDARLNWTCAEHGFR